MRSKLKEYFTEMKKIILFIAVNFLIFSSNLFAANTIDITRAKFEPIPIALLQFLNTDNISGSMGNNILSVISSDLEGSGMFKIIDSAAFIEQNIGETSTPKYAAWRSINAQGLLTGAIEVYDNKLKVRFRLWDPFGEKQLVAPSFASGTDQWRRIAHKIADEIYKNLTGEDGYFDTKITYVSESGNALKRVKRIAVMDHDGENHKFITNGKSIVLTPRFSKDTSQILYLSYAKGKPKVFIRELSSGHEKLLGDFPGMTYAPRFSPDGKKAIMSVAYNGNSDIYDIDLRSLKQTRLTNDTAIDVSATYSADGEKIVFNSDRGGSRQLYIMNKDGSDQRRISFGKGLYTTPVWSPRGDYIAFTKSIKGSGFYIGVMRPDGSGERILTQGYLVEGPTWSPNGRVIIFTRVEQGSRTKGEKPKLYSVDITGHNEMEIITPMDGSDPDWSGLLK